MRRRREKEKREESKDTKLKETTEKRSGGRSMEMRGRRGGLTRERCRRG